MSIAADMEIQERFDFWLTAYLQTEVDALRTELGVSWSLTVGEVHRDVSTEPLDRVGAVSIGRPSSFDLPDQFKNFGGPTKREATLRIRCSVGRLDPRERDLARSIMAEGVCKVLERYWRTDTRGMFHLSSRIEDASASRRQTEGVVGLRGPALGSDSAGQDVIDPIDVVVTVRQRVTRTIQLTV